MNDGYYRLQMIYITANSRDGARIGQGIPSPRSPRPLFLVEDCHQTCATPLYFVSGAHYYYNSMLPVPLCFVRTKRVKATASS